MPTKATFPYVVGWSLYMGQTKPQIAAAVAQAEEDHAPIDATYRDRHNVWHTFSELDTSTSTRQEVAALARPYLAQTPI